MSKRSSDISISKTIWDIINLSADKVGEKSTTEEESKKIKEWDEDIDFEPVKDGRAAFVEYGYDGDKPNA